MCWYVWKYNKAKGPKCKKGYIIMHLENHHSDFFVCCKIGNDLLFRPIILFDFFYWDLFLLLKHLWGVLILLIFGQISVSTRFCGVCDSVVFHASTFKHHFLWHLKLPVSLSTGGNWHKFRKMSTPLKSHRRSISTFTQLSIPSCPHSVFSYHSICAIIGLNISTFWRFSSMNLKESLMQE